MHAYAVRLLLQMMVQPWCYSANCKGLTPSVSLGLRPRTREAGCHARVGHCFTMPCHVCKETTCSVQAHQAKVCISVATRQGVCYRTGKRQQHIFCSFSLCHAPTCCTCGQNCAKYGAITCRQCDGQGALHCSLKMQQALFAQQWQVCRISLS